MREKKGLTKTHLLCSIFPFQDVKAFEMDQLKAEMGRNCKHLDEVFKPLLLRINIYNEFQANHEIKTREEKIHKYLATIKSLQPSDTLRSPKKHKFYKAAQIQGRFQIASFYKNIFI